MGPTQAEPPVVAAESDDFVGRGLFAHHYPRLVRGLVLAGATGAQAEDVAQEAFARTFGHWRRVRSGTNPAGYVSTVAFRLLRRQRRFNDRVAGSADLSVPGPEDQVSLRVSVEQALQVMPPRQRACAALCIYLGLSVPEAAKALGVAPGTVRTQLHRARHSLQVTAGESAEG